MGNARWIRKLLCLSAKVMIGLLLIVDVYPIVWMFLNSFRTNNEIYANPIGVPKEFDFSVFIEAWIKADFGRALFNSFYIAFFRLSLSSRRRPVSLCAYYIKRPGEEYYLQCYRKPSGCIRSDHLDSVVCINEGYGASGSSMGEYSLRGCVEFSVGNDDIQRRISVHSAGAVRIGGGRWMFGHAFFPEDGVPVGEAYVFQCCYLSCIVFLE